MRDGTEGLLVTVADIIALPAFKNVEDVYKRQEWASFIAGLASNPILVVVTLLNIGVLVVNGATDAPVSYTHLDVYKRQAASTDAFPISPASAACCVAVFRERGLIETHTAFGADGMARSIHVVETQDKVELTDSVRYREGLGEREVFHAFRDWAMKSDSATLHIRVSRPILPGDVAGDARER